METIRSRSTIVGLLLAATLGTVGCARSTVLSPASASPHGRGVGITSSRAFLREWTSHGVVAEVADSDRVWRLRGDRLQFCRSLPGHHGCITVDTRMAAHELIIAPDDPGAARARRRNELAGVPLSEPRAVGGVWVRKLSSTFGISKLAFCEANPEPQCRPAAMPEPGLQVVQIVAAMHRQSPEPQDVIWVGVQPSGARSLWGVATLWADPALVRCSASRPHARVSCEFVKGV